MRRNGLHRDDLGLRFKDLTTGNTAISQYARLEARRRDFDTAAFLRIQGVNPFNNVIRRAIDDGLVAAIVSCQFEINSKLLKDFNVPERNGHVGKPCYIVGNGPSLKKNEHHLANIDTAENIVIGVNGGIRSCPPGSWFFTIELRAQDAWLKDLDASRYNAVLWSLTQIWFLRQPWRNLGLFNLWVHCFKNDPAREYAGIDDQLNRAIEEILESLEEQPMEIPEPPPYPDKRR